MAGRVGLCGHVYCWPCVLHYEAAHDKKPPPCPVCTTPLQVIDMKPTKMVQWSSSNEEVIMFCFLIVDILTNTSSIFFYILISIFVLNVIFEYVITYIFNMVAINFNK